MKPRQQQITRQQVLQLAGEAQVDPRTVARLYADSGAVTKQLVRDRILAAAKKLKISQPT